MKKKRTDHIGCRCFLTDLCEDLKSVYEAETENVTLTFLFGGSGALQAQIEEELLRTCSISVLRHRWTPCWNRP